MSSVTDLLRQAAEQHARELTVQAIYHAKEIVKLKARIETLERTLAPIAVPGAYVQLKDVPEPEWMTHEDIRMLADGWLQHDGSECPIPESQHGEYEIRYRDGTLSLAANDYHAASFYWKHHGIPKDIVAYRLLDKRQPTGTENEGSDQD